MFMQYHMQLLCCR